VKQQQICLQSVFRKKKTTKQNQNIIHATRQVLGFLSK